MPTPPVPASIFSACLRRFELAGLRLVVTAPTDTGSFVRGLRTFPERKIDPLEHAMWSTAYRVFRGGSDRPHDRGSWRILAADADGRVVGAVTGRFFCGEVISDYVSLFSVLHSTGPVFRELCELAVLESYTTARDENATPGEISDWAVERGRHAPLVAVTLARGITALAAAFQRFVGIAAADQRRGELSRLIRLGGTPLGRQGKFLLPPFVYHATGAQLRLLLVDTGRFDGRRRQAVAADLTRLREGCVIISPA